MARKLAYAFSLYVGLLHVCYLRAACVVHPIDLMNLTVRIIKFLFQNEVNFNTRDRNVNHRDAVQSGKQGMAFRRNLRHKYLWLKLIFFVTSCDL
jgi:hypothetical protein